ncbi:hypothetical protein BATDEDRAFT_22408 [Batrachochytrium dendrobatidis JAM81]|uniref:Uncharacterized protein n=2 Tax=Batrachochytrium dendrobatidis TaxID=109871 RepID=F4NU88_BATDJ|nr:uncharacterized protein BATDEDRAFT_22408 [Batrachochytrium dendrobatidis JAM81]EGF83590.1 hypothetical protein BATDEDRAFT_22408 [Batrachochytrium dendrobatidis JAM81]OAJ37401.1 hypothetical protein BDEG_21423 [Batrachochytrium dendrobatidis JEL423]|eukprot:XP_006675561.1 hypothetical protein BATDEDRAFT_22408 [Batrachochytrium dendrobatidis JAM81]
MGIQSTKVYILSLIITLATGTSLVVSLINTVHISRYAIYARTWHAASLFLTTLALLSCLIAQTVNLYFDVEWTALIAVFISLSSVAHVLLQIQTLSPCFGPKRSSGDKKGCMCKIASARVWSILMQTAIVAVHFFTVKPVYDRAIFGFKPNSNYWEMMWYINITWPWIMIVVAIDFTCAIKYILVLSEAIEMLGCVSIDSEEDEDGADLKKLETKHSILYDKKTSTDPIQSKLKRDNEHRHTSTALSPSSTRSINVEKMSRGKRSALFAAYVRGLILTAGVSIAVVIMVLLTVALQDPRIKVPKSSKNYSGAMWTCLVLGHIELTGFCALLTSRNIMLARMQDPIYRVYGEEATRDEGFSSADSLSNVKK